MRELHCLGSVQKSLQKAKKRLALSAATVKRLKGGYKGLFQKEKGGRSKRTEDRLHDPYKSETVAS